MNDIGEYGRTNKGKIFKFCWVENEKYILVLTDSTYYVGVKSFEKYWLDEDEKIVKHSPNIIDLIEVGDYVNGYRVEKIEDGYVYVDYCWDCELYTLVTNDSDNIKSIVTKEQMRSIEYRVEE